jgi:uncharacterized protein
MNQCCTKNRFSFKALFVSLSIFLVFLLLNKLNIIPAVFIDKNTFLPLFFIFGLVASISACSSLSLSLMLTVRDSSKSFLIGRILSYTFFGAILGLIGQYLKFSPVNFSWFFIFISLILILNGLNMIGLDCFCFSNFKFLKKIPQISPFWLGSLTFFLPCGFTFTAQTIALVSGNLFLGASIIFLFAIGSSVPLFLISTSRFSKAPIFSKIAGFLIIFFSLFTLYRQINIKSISVLASTTDKYQTIKMTITDSGYFPNNFKIKANLPVKWEITNNSASSCTNTLTSHLLLNQSVKINSYSTITENFIAPSKTGVYKFSCSMGMINGSIEVIN